MALGALVFSEKGNLELADFGNGTGDRPIPLKEAHALINGLK